MQLNKKIKFLIIALVIVIFGYTIYVNWPVADIDNNNNPSFEDSVYCTMDAKICPDGSYVGRVGPNCEFAPCPTLSTVNNQTVSVTTNTKPDILSKYSKLGATYISLLDYGEFKPKIESSNEPFICNEEKFTENGERETVKKVINKRVYCVSKKYDGAAGSTVIEYDYVFVEAEQTVRLNFTLKYTDCGNIGFESQVMECEKERKSFNDDIIADQMARSFAVE